MDNKDIIESIKKSLTGDVQTDVLFLQTEMNIYKSLKNNEVVIAIASMLFEYFDPEIKKKLDLKTHKVLDDRRCEYETVVNLVSQNKLEEAKAILIKLTDTFRNASYAKDSNYYDFDQMVEYFIFCENVSKAKQLRIKRYPEPITYYHYQLADIYLVENDTEKAIISLEEALAYNPRCQYVMQTLASVYDSVGRSDEAFELLRESLLYAYDREQIAYCYNYFGKHYEKEGKYDAAIVCYLSGDVYNNLDDNKQKVLELSKKCGNFDVNNKEMVNSVFDKYRIQQGPSRLVVSAINEFIDYTIKIKDYQTTQYLLFVAHQLLKDESYKAKYDEIEEILTEKRNEKK